MIESRVQARGRTADSPCVQVCGSALFSNAKVSQSRHSSDSLAGSFASNAFMLLMRGAGLTRGGFLPQQSVGTAFSLKLC